MARVVALNCPSCGASLPEDSLTCSYCGVRSEISKDRTTVVMVGIPCPQCKSENAPTRRYCGKCGSTLVWTCFLCGEPNPWGVKYCGGCGVEHFKAQRLALERQRQQFRERTPAAQQKFDQLAAKARAELPPKMQVSLAEQGWNYVESHLEEYNRLFAEVAMPDEGAMIFRAGRSDDYADLLHNDYRGMLRTSFVATNQSFIFLKRGGFLSGPQGAVAVRIPFSDVTSVEVDTARGDLVIRFAQGEACVHLLKVARRASIDDSAGAADLMGFSLAAFLPTAVVANWPFGSSEIRKFAEVANSLTNPIQLDTPLPPTSFPEALGPLK